MRGTEHGFTRVDEQPDPDAWIDVLDRVRGEPAYVAYKRRLAELLRPVAGARCLEVGTGTGDDALALGERFGVEVVGVDSSETMVAEARRRGLSGAQVADAHALPFADATFAGAWADRTFQHLARPETALAELMRVTRPGGRIAVADPDYDTQVVELADQGLARRVLRFRADHAVRNGALAHRLGGLFVAHGLGEVEVEGVPVVLRNPDALDSAMGLRTWAATAHERGLLPADDVEAWQRQLDETISRGVFLYAFTVFLTAGTRP